jgi:glycosyltransferase involved in cell wall biosynthesis
VGTGSPSLTASVVIATHSRDRVELVKQCVGSVWHGTLAPRQIVVVVDSNPSVQRELEQGLARSARVVASDGAGASAARNVGLREATGDVVAFVDDDADPEPHWLESLLTVFQRHPDVVGVGGRILPAYEPGSRVLPPELLWLVGCTYAGHRRDEGPISRPIGANMSFRSSAVAVVGGFPTSFGPDPTRRRSSATTKTGSNEELVLSLALRRRFGDHCLWYCPDARVRHFVPRVRVTAAYGLTRCWIEGTTKADVRALYGRGAMLDDRRYLVGVLLPGIARRLRAAGRARDVAPVMDATALACAAVVTGAGYATRTLAHAVAGSRRG